MLTRRNVDPGALINSGAGTTGGAGATGRELFDIARVDPLRVYVSVPQAYAPNIRVGMKANVTLQEFPGQKFLGTVVRTADAIDPATRTLNTEVDVPNKDGKLLPGSFGQVHFAAGTSVPRITIPVNAMLFRAQGPQVAVVDQDGKVHLRPINIGRDFGATLEILGGLDASDQIIINPSDSLEEGQQVHVAKPSQGDSALVKRLPPVEMRESRCASRRQTCSFAGVLCSSLYGLGCTVGPGYKRPTAQVPDTWKGEGPWQTAAPKDAIPKGAWWQIFHDAELDRLEQDLLQANQSLEAARDRLSQARAQARIASSAYFPTVSTDPSGQRERFSGNRPLAGGTPQTVTPFTRMYFSVPFSVSYELDLFGSVRRNLEAANASLQGSAADLENVRLVLTAELAADYFNLRESDREAGVVRESVEIQQKGLDLVNRRHEGGVANGLEVAQQAALLDSTATQLSLVLQQRAQFEHAIAVLTGKSASAFSLAEAQFDVVASRDSYRSSIGDSGAAS